MKKLYPSFADPDMWRDEDDRQKLNKSEWRQLRKRILIRDDYTCQYCGFRAEKHQIVHHIDGYSKNNSHENLETICPICNLINHSGQGCVVQEIVDLYKSSKYNQNEIIQITRKMRAEGKNDDEIIKYLGLKGKMPFKMDWKYLKQLYGFITSREASEPYTNRALSYVYNEEKKSNSVKNKPNQNRSIITLNSFIEK